jgi:hypothetical protein
VGIQYGIFLSDNNPAYGVGIQHGIFLSDNNPAYGVGIQYGIFLLFALKYQAYQIGAEGDRYGNIVSKIDKIETKY